MRGLLDEDLLDGPHEILTGLRPRRLGRLIEFHNPRTGGHLIVPSSERAARTPTHSSTI